MLYIKTKKLTKKSRTYAACRGFFLYSTVKHPALEGIVYAWIKNGMKQKPEEIIGMLSAMIEGSGRITFQHLAEMR